MSNSVVPAAAVAQAKQLVRNKKLVKRTDDQKPHQDEQPVADANQDAANAVQVAQTEQGSRPASASSMSSNSSFGSALSAAAESTASLVSASAQDDGGSTGDDGDGAGGTVLLVGAVGLAGLGVAVLAGGGGKSNDAPTITSGTTATVAENAAVTTVVYQAQATDPDGDPLTYSLSGTDAAAFNISSAGAVTLKASADFETKSSYSFSVVASDGELTASQNVTLTVTDVAEAPVFTSGTTASVAENSATSTVVYDANVSGTGSTFALTGADAAAFAIDAATGEVRFVASPNFETKSSYAIGVVATKGGLSTTQNVAVTVSNVNEAPTFTSGTTASVAENTAVSTVIYDAEATGASSFSLTGTDAAAFTINATTGQVRFVASPNFEAKSSYAIGVVAAHADGEKTTQNVAVTVTDVAVEGPAFASGASATVAENSATSTVVYDADATGTGTVTYALTGTDAAAFNINATTGVVTFKVSPDFETKSSYAIGVTATDSNGSTTKDVAVAITDVDEAAPTNLDGLGNPGSDNGALSINAGEGPRIFNEGDGATSVLISNFSDDDVIVLVDADDFDDYSFTSGTGADQTDLIISFQTAAGTASIIVLDDVLTSTQVFNYDTAANSVGFDFMTLG